MGKIKKFLLNNIKVIAAFVLGLVIAASTGYAATILFASGQVSYDNSSSGSSSTNVQDALDELYTAASSCGSTSSATPSFYAFGNYGYGDFPEDLTTPPENRYIYLAKYDSPSKLGVCIALDFNYDEQVCFRYNYDYDKEISHMQQVFENLGGSCESAVTNGNLNKFTCSVYTPYELTCYLDIDTGEVFCSYGYNSTYCRINYDGSTECEWSEFFLSEECGGVEAYDYEGDGSIDFCNYSY